MERVIVQEPATRPNGERYFTDKQFLVRQRLGLVQVGRRSDGLPTFLTARKYREHITSLILQETEK